MSVSDSGLEGLDLAQLAREFSRADRELTQALKNVRSAEIDLESTKQQLVNAQRDYDVTKSYLLSRVSMENQIAEES